MTNVDKLARRVVMYCDEDAVAELGRLASEHPDDAKVQSTYAWAPYDISCFQDDATGETTVARLADVAGRSADDPRIALQTTFGSPVSDTRP